MKPPYVKDGLVVCWPDTHHPDHHQGAVDSIVEFIGQVQPELVIQLGDFNDVKSIARFSVDTPDEDGRLFARELAAGRRTLGALRDMYGGDLVWIPGNHEERLARFLRTRGRGLYLLDCLTIPALLDMDDYGVIRPVGDLEAEAPYRFAHDTIAVHGERLGVRAGFSVDKEMTRFGGNVVMGHCHRLSLGYRSVGDRETWGVEAGHLADRSKASYLQYGQADWRMGFAVIEVHGKTTVPHVVAMDKRGRFFYEGVRFGR